MRCRNIAAFLTRLWRLEPTCATLVGHAASCALLPRSYNAAALLFALTRAGNAGAAGRRALVDRLADSFRHRPRLLHRDGGCGAAVRLVPLTVSSMLSLPDWRPSMGAFDLQQRCELAALHHASRLAAKRRAGRQECAPDASRGPVQPLLTSVALVRRHIQRPGLPCIHTDDLVYDCELYHCMIVESDIVYDCKL